MTLIKSKLRLVSFVFFLLAIFFYAVQFWNYKQQIPGVTINGSSIIVMLLSVLLVVFISGLGGVIWHLLLRDHSVVLNPTVAISVFFISQFGKYLPGNVGQHVGRVFMAREIGIPIPVIMNTMLVEILWGVGILAAMALLSLVLFADVIAHNVLWQFGSLQLGLGVALILLMPWMGVGLINRCLPVLAKRLSAKGVIAAPKLLTALTTASLFLLSFFIMGFILKIQAQWFFGVTEGSVFNLTCLFSIAWLAGYIVPGAPGGLGVREAMMVLLLSPILGAGTAVGLGITLRVTTTVGDAVAFLIGLWLRRSLVY